jgi:hypothetical protein
VTSTEPDAVFPAPVDVLTPEVVATFPVTSLLEPVPDDAETPTDTLTVAELAAPAPVATAAFADVDDPAGTPEITRPTAPATKSKTSSLVVASGSVA